MYYYPQQGMNNNGYLSSQPVQQISNIFGLKGRPVSSIEEVRAAQIDFDGSLFVFPDIAHNRIYTKQISLDGTASLNMYELAAAPAQTPNNLDNYVTKDELKEALSKLTVQDKPAKMGEEAAPAAFKF